MPKVQIVDYELEKVYIFNFLENIGSKCRVYSEEKRNKIDE